MKRADVDDLDAESPTDGVDRHELAGPLDAAGLALNHYRVAPGEGLPAGLHAHADQEEVFVVLDGVATFETLLARDEDRPGEESGPGDPTREAGEVTVAAGEAVRFAPGEFQSGYNDGDDDLAVLAIGAPQDSDDVRIPAECPECGHPDLRFAVGDGVPLFVCPSCGTERVPTACPDCGSDDLRVTLGEGGTVTVCRGCDATFDEPPVETPG